MKPQKAIITLTDNPLIEGNVKCEITFDPPVSVKKKTTPAILMAIDMVSHAAKNNEHTKPEVKS